MTTQLRLVETPGTAAPARAKGSAAPRRVRASTSRSATARGRRVRWDGDWRLSADRRRIGLEGVAAARAALARAHRPGPIDDSRIDDSRIDESPIEPLSEAS